MKMGKSVFTRRTKNICILYSNENGKKVQKNGKKTKKINWKKEKYLKISIKENLIQIDNL